MPNIKISALPPALQPLDDPNTLFEVTTIEGGEEVSRKISLSDIAAATGLDASFLTLSVNAQLPNERVLTEGANVTFVDTGPNGTLTISVSGGAFGNVFKVGTPVDNQIGVWTGDGTIEGDPNFTWDGSQLLLPLENVPGAPTIGFGDGDSGFFQPFDDNLQLSLVGASRFFWELDSYNASAGTGPAMINAAASSTVPGFVPRRSDPNTGIGSAGNDILSLIAGGVSIAQATSVGNNQFAIAQSGSSSVPELTSLADPDTGFRWTGANITVWIGAGSRTWNFSTAKFFSEFSNGPALLNEISSDVNPTVVPDHADPNTGMGHPSGSDELSLIAGGVEGIRIEETAGNVFITYFGPILVPFGSVGAASVGFDGDDDTGFFRPVADAFAITAGGVESVRFAELSSQIIQTNSNQVGLTASVTQTQAGGLALLSSYNEIATVANVGDAVTAFDVAAGTRLVVINNGANDLQLFPAVGDNFGEGIDTAVTIDAGSAAVFIGRDVTNWDLLQNQSPGGSVFQGLGTWRYRTEITSPPGIGQVRFNNADPTLATEMFLAETNDDGTDVNNFLNLLTAGSFFYIQNRADSDNFFLVEISSNVDNGTDRTFGIANITLQGAEPDNNTRVIIVASASGSVSLPGTVTNSMLRFDGADFIEETQVQVTAAGIFSIFDAGLTDNISISHDGASGLIASLNSTDLNFTGVTGAYTFDRPIRIPNGVGTAAAPAYAFSPATNEGMFRSALGVGISFSSAEQLRISNTVSELFSESFRLRPAIGAESLFFAVDPVSDPLDMVMATTGLTDWHIRGVGLERFFLREPNLAMLEKAAAPADEVGIGQFWVRDDTPNTAMFTNDAGVDKSLVNDAVQARRTTGYILTGAFVDVTMDTTDIETDDAVLDHDLVTNTDNIIIGQPGTYECTYDFDVITNETSGDPIIDMGCRVRLNDAGTGIAGSLANPYVFRDGSVGGADGQVQVHVSNTFIFTAAAADFITLQLDQTDLSGSGEFEVFKICMKVRRLL